MNLTVLFFISSLIVINVTCILFLKREGVKISSENAKKIFMKSIILLLSIYLSGSIVYYCIFPTKIEDQTMFLIIASIGALVLLYDALFSFHGYYKKLIEKKKKINKI